MLALTASFHDNLGKLVPDCQTILGLAAAGDDEGVGGESVTRKRVQIISTKLQSNHRH